VHGTRESVMNFVIVFSLLLNKDVFALDLFLVTIYEVKFYSFSYILFSQILKNNRISLWSVL
jgi:hypothetical protein